MILGPSGENIYPEEIENVINNMEEVNESIVLERDGRLVALVQFNDNIINWNQEGEDQFFEKLQAKKEAIMNYVNRHVNKSSKINDVEVVKEPFEKTATQKIRRFKYSRKEGQSQSAEKKQGKVNMSWCQFSTNDRNGERVDEGGGTDEKDGDDGRCHNERDRPVNG